MIGGIHEGKQGWEKRELVQTKRILTFGWHVVGVCLGHTHVLIIDFLLFLHSGKGVKL
jgi:hypothetical protein